MSEIFTKSRIWFWCVALAVISLFALGIGFVGELIDGLLRIFGPWAWVGVLALWICAMLATAVFAVLRRRNGSR